jgi:hypothetical protein
LEAFTKKENAERKRETEDINEALRTENEKRIKEAEALKEKMERENKAMQVRQWGSKFAHERCSIQHHLLVKLALHIFNEYLCSNKAPCYFEHVT